MLFLSCCLFAVYFGSGRVGENSVWCRWSDSIPPRLGPRRRRQAVRYYGWRWTGSLGVGEETLVCQRVRGKRFYFLSSFSIASGVNGFLPVRRASIQPCRCTFPSSSVVRAI